MRNLKELRSKQRSMKFNDLFSLVRSFTIQEKIAFSPKLSKQRIKDKLHDLRTKQVPNRSVLLSIPDEEVVFYWLRNFIHPDLKHWVYRIPKDTAGVSKRVLELDIKKHSLRYYENGQQNYSYTLEDIEKYINN